MVHKKSYVQGALILTGAGIISKLIGALYRIPFANLVGTEGIGLYQMAYPIYTALLAVSTGGVPVAVSIMVAEAMSRGDRHGANRILLVAMSLLGVLGLGLTLALFQGAKYLAEHVLYDSRAMYSLMFISPALFLLGLVSPLRGYFQGQQNMVPTAVSQVVEQTVRVITVFLGAYLLLPYGLEYAAAGATLGAATGGLTALIALVAFLLLQPVRSSRTTNLSYLACAKRLGKLAVPVCLGGLVMPLMQGVDALIVPLRLQTAGYDVTSATALYGELSGMAGPLINLPGVLTMALAASLVPVVSSALAQGKLNLVQRRIEEVLRLAIIICLPAAIGLSALAPEIGITLYNLPQLGTTLAALAPAAFFLGLHQASAGALQGMGRTGVPVSNLLLGGIIKVIVTYELTGLPQFGVRGAAIGTVLGFATAAGLNFWHLNRLLSKGVPSGKLLLKPVTAGTIMAVVLALLKHSLTTNRMTGLVLVACGGLVYGIALVLIGEIKAKEICRLPLVGDGLANLLLVLRIVRE